MEVSVERNCVLQVTRNRNSNCFKSTDHAKLHPSKFLLVIMFSATAPDIQLSIKDLDNVYTPNQEYDALFGTYSLGDFFVFSHPLIRPSKVILCNDVLWCTSI